MGAHGRRDYRQSGRRGEGGRPVLRLRGLVQLLVDSKQEIRGASARTRSFSGRAASNSQDRAISLLQQAGIAELRPYIQGFKGWKVRVYRAVLNAIQRHWTAERYIRVTDDDGLGAVHPDQRAAGRSMTGHPNIVNAIGSLDVDVIIDEGPDSINMMADTYDALIAMATSGAQVPPQVLIELSPGIDGRTKEKALGIHRAGTEAGTGAASRIGRRNRPRSKKTQSETMLNVSKARQASMPQPGKPESFELPPELQIADSIASTRDKDASAAAEVCEGEQDNQEASLRRSR